MFELGVNLVKKIKPVKLVAFDVDGVMTTGELLFLPDGQEVKQFNVQDGLGIKLLARGGLQTAIITGRKSPQVELRAKALGITYLVQGRDDKLTALQELWAQTGLSAAETAYIGDDLPDLAAINSVSFSATVPSAHAVLKEAADYCTARDGGQGAAREFCEVILQGQGQLRDLLAEYAS